MNANLNELMNALTQQTLEQLIDISQTVYERVEGFAGQEFLIPASEAQINAALKRFVVDNVDAVLDLHLDLHENWLRLYATIHTQGIFATVAVNLRLVHVQLDRYRQRFVFGQLGNTDIITLYSNNYLKAKAAKAAVWVFHRVLKRDPLGLILGKINLVKQKEDILYLDIGRWLKKNKKIMATLKKVQVNHGYLAEGQLILKANVNVADALNIGSNAILITEADNPKAKRSDTPAKSA